MNGHEELCGLVNELLAVSEHKEIEVEARIRKQLVNETSVSRLLRDDSFGWNTRAYTEKKRSSKVNRRCTYRHRCYETKTSITGCFNEDEVICKSSLMKLDANDKWCSIYVSTEKPIPSMSQNLEDVKTTLVTRHRGSVGAYYVDVTYSLMPKDQTVGPLPGTSHTSSFGMNGTKADISYEKIIRVEVEAASSASFEYDGMMDVVSKVCHILQDSPCFMSYYDWRIATHVAKSDYGPFCMDKGRYQKPNTMTMRDFAEVKNDVSNWVVTPKVDGTRRFLSIINDRLFDIDIAGNVRYFGAMNGKNDDSPFHTKISVLCGNFALKHEKGQKILDAFTSKQGDESITIFDTEYIESKYYVFDMVVFHGKYCGNEPFRFELLERVLSVSAFAEKGIDVEIKPYRSFGSFDVLTELYEEFETHYDIDGLIFMNKRNSYIQPVFKWKRFPTVDLEIRGQMVFTSDDKQVEIEWRAQEHDLESVHTPLPKTSNFESFCTNRYEKGQREADIWEFGYSRETNTLVPMRPRHDKVFANSLAIVKKTLTNAVPGSIFTGVGCYLMRKYHNRVKTDAIRHANDDKATILDVGTGQGGDIYKWKRASRVYCVEPSEDATEEMIRRMGRDDAFREKVRVFNLPLRDLDVDLVSDKIDIFTVFFCANLFEQDDWTKLKQVIKKRGSKKCRLLMIALTDPRSHDDDCFTLRMTNMEEYHISIHGTRISGMTESRVDPTRLKYVLSECNMENVLQQKLNEDTFMTAKERALSSMYTLFVFKRTAQKH